MCQVMKNPTKAHVMDVFSMDEESQPVLSLSPACNEPALYNNGGNDSSNDSFKPPGFLSEKVYNFVTSTLDERINIPSVTYEEIKEGVSDDELAEAFEAMEEADDENYEEDFSDDGEESDRTVESPVTIGWFKCPPVDSPVMRPVKREVECKVQENTLEDLNTIDLYDVSDNEDSATRMKSKLSTISDETVYNNTVTVSDANVASLSVENNSAVDVLSENVNASETSAAVGVGSNLSEANVVAVESESVDVIPQPEGEVGSTFVDSGPNTDITYDDILEMVPLNAESLFESSDEEVENRSCRVIVHEAEVHAEDIVDASQDGDITLVKNVDPEQSSVPVELHTSQPDGSKSASEQCPTPKSKKRHTYKRIEMVSSSSEEEVVIIDVPNIVLTNENNTVVTNATANGVIDIIDSLPGTSANLTQESGDYATPCGGRISSPVIKINESPAKVGGDLTPCASPVIKTSNSPTKDGVNVGSPSINPSTTMFIKSSASPSCYGDDEGTTSTSDRTFIKGDTSDGDPLADVKKSSSPPWEIEECASPRTSSPPDPVLLSMSYSVAHSMSVLDHCPKCGTGISGARLSDDSEENDPQSRNERCGTCSKPIPPVRQSFSFVAPEQDLETVQGSDVDPLQLVSSEADTGDYVEQNNPVPYSDGGNVDVKDIKVEHEPYLAEGGRHRRLNPSVTTHDETVLNFVSQSSSNSVSISRIGVSQLLSQVVVNLERISVTDKKSRLHSNDGVGDDRLAQPSTSKLRKTASTKTQRNKVEVSQNLSNSKRRSQKSEKPSATKKRNATFVELSDSSDSSIISETPPKKRRNEGNIVKSLRKRSKRKSSKIDASGSTNDVSELSCAELTRRSSKKRSVGLTVDVAQDLGNSRRKMERRSKPKSSVKESVARKLSSRSAVYHEVCKLHSKDLSKCNCKNINISETDSRSKSIQNRTVEGNAHLVPEEEEKYSVQVTPRRLKRKVTKGSVHPVERPAASSESEEPISEVILRLKKKQEKDHSLSNKEKLPGSSLEEGSIQRKCSKASVSASDSFGIASSSSQSPGKRTRNNAKNSGDANEDLAGQKKICKKSATSLALRAFISQSSLSSHSTSQLLSPTSVRLERIPEFRKKNK